MSVCDTPGHTQIKSAQKWKTDIDTHIQTNIRRICLFIVILGVVARRWSHNNHYTNNVNSDKSYQPNHIKDSIK